MSVQPYIIYAKHSNATQTHIFPINILKAGFVNNWMIVGDWWSDYSHLFFSDCTWCYPIVSLENLYLLMKRFAEKKKVIFCQQASDKDFMALTINSLSTWTYIINISILGLRQQ